QFSYDLDGEVTVRDRSLLDPSERGVEYLPSEEIDAAIRLTLLPTHGVVAQALETDVARRFGQSRASKDLRGAIESRTLRLRKEARVVERYGFLEWVDA